MLVFCHPFIYALFTLYSDSPKKYAIRTGTHYLMTYHNCSLQNTKANFVQILFRPFSSKHGACLAHSNAFSKIQDHPCFPTWQITYLVCRVFASPLAKQNSIFYARLPSAVISLFSQKKFLKEFLIHQFQSPSCRQFSVCIEFLAFPERKKHSTSDFPSRNVGAKPNCLGIETFRHS